MMCCRSGSVLGAAALLAAGAVVGVAANEAVRPVHAATAQPEGEMSVEDMMAESMRLGSPGEHHKRLDHMVGDWDASATFHMPDGSQMTSDGSLSSEWVLGGRFLKADFHLDDMMGMAFDGISFVGYDNAKGQYVSVWMDNMSTGVIVHKGWFEGDAFVTMGKSAHGGDMKIVSEPTGEGTVEDTFFERHTEEGEWFESGSIVYTKR